MIRLLCAWMLLSILGPTVARADLAYSLMLFEATFHGFEHDPESGGPDPAPDTLIAAGDGFTLVGFVTAPSGCYLPLADMHTHEYTIVIDRLRVQNRSTYLHFTSWQWENGARIRLFRDSRVDGTPATLGVYPPNATTPSTFSDADGSGAVVLAGTIRAPFGAFNVSTDTFSFGGFVTWTAGTWLSGIPERLRAESYLSGAFMAEGDAPGFFASGLMACFLEGDECGATSSSTATWGRLKSLYR